jgi:hypothetical protein
MRRHPFFRWLLLVAVLLPALAQAREPAAAPSIQIGGLPGQPRVILAARGDHISRVPAPAGLRPASAQAAVINVTYNGFSNEARQAFQRAVDIWSGLITSPLPIKVVATWEPLPSGVLGAAGPNNFYRDFPQAPQSSTWYAVALANKLAGTDLNGATEEIDASFNSNFSDWYFGTDGQTPAGEYDLVTVVLHELGHGLGFVDSMNYAGGVGSWGAQSGRPFIYDRFVVNGAGQQLVNTNIFANSSTALGAQLRSNNIFFSGPLATAGAGGTRPKLYAPSTWQDGSSIAHLDSATYPTGNPNTLMRPALPDGTSIHDPGPITMGIFQDLGWTTETAADTPIAGLTATNNGPTPLGSPTTLTAQIGSGTNVSYAWDFGDGNSGIAGGTATPHTYAATGQYQATVTATNSVSSATATTTVVVTNAGISGLQADANGPTNLGNLTTFTATVAGGTNVSYAWDFGDGSSGSGASVAHAYQAIGLYSASVTASNSTGSSSFPLSVEVLPASVGATITSAAGGTLATPDGSFSAVFPTGAVAQTVYISYTAHLAPSQPLASDLALLRDFTLEARTSDGRALTQFALPYTLAINYTDAELAARGIDETNLKLIERDGSGWKNSLPCTGCAVDTATNRITISLDYVGEFAVVGKQQPRLFLPMIYR